MDKLRIVGWTYFDCELPTKKYDAETFREVLHLIQKEIMDNNYVFSGEEHQNSLTGVPVLSDGTCFRASMRSWGNIMASVYTGPNGEQLSYMDFYMSLNESILPEFKDVDIEPAKDIETSVGCTTKQDRQMIDDSIAMDMMFMTTDKVLKKLYEQKKKENKN